jgi:hypothetical protein
LPLKCFFQTSGTAADLLNRAGEREETGGFVFSIGELGITEDTSREAQEKLTGQKRTKKIKNLFPI